MSYLNGLVVFPHFLQFQSEFGNKEMSIENHRKSICFLEVGCKVISRRKKGKNEQTHVTL